MKRILYLLLLAIGLSTACGEGYDDSAIKEQLAQLERRIEAAKTVALAYQNKLFITSIKQTADGYFITFSDGTSTALPHGKDGNDGAPGQAGSSWISNITIGEEEVCFTMTDGRQFTIPLASLVKQIKQLSFVPRHSDLMATVYHYSVAQSRLEIDFQLSPREMSGLLLEKWEQYVTIEARTGSAAIATTTLPITLCEADLETGIFTLHASALSLGEGFFADQYHASAALVVSDGITTVASDYIPLKAVEEECPVETEFPDYGAVKAFPTAVGYGRNATGGRGGEIYHVTNLNDSGSGSLRDAISQSNRTIVFDVAGVINLQSVLVFKSNQTVLFQTAPGDGIELYNHRTSASGASNLIVRYMRVRVGKQAPGENLDAGGLSNGSNVIFDHCSFAWAEDENFSINSDGKGTRPQNITLQNSIIGQGCMNHSAGGLIQTSDTEGVTIFGNLLIDNGTRNFKVKGLNQYINNVVYNWGKGGCYDMGGDSEGHSDTWIENNYFIKGPCYVWRNTPAADVSDDVKNNPDICIPNGTNYYEVLNKENPTKPFKGGNSLFDTYCVGNWYDHDLDGTLGGVEITTDNWTTYCSGSPVFLSAPSSKHPAIEEMTSALEAYNRVVEGVGATLPRRDKVDGYMIDELLSLGTKGVIIRNQRNRQQYSLGDDWMKIDTADNRPTDSDKDGIPDAVEDQYGLNKNDASDAAKIAANGYSNIENYTFLLERK